MPAYIASMHVDATASASSLNAEQLRALIDAAGITQARAAQITRASLRALQQWLAGDREMPAAAAELFAVALVAHGYADPADVAPWLSPAVAALCERGAPGAGRRRAAAG